MYVCMYVTGKMALVDWWFPHLDDHKSPLRNFNMIYILDTTPGWRFWLNQNRVEPEICILKNFCRWYTYKLFINVGVLTIINNKSLSTHFTNGEAHLCLRDCVPVHLNFSMHDEGLLKQLGPNPRVSASVGPGAVDRKFAFLRCFLGGNSYL